MKNMTTVMLPKWCQYLCVVGMLFSMPVKADTWTTIYASDFIHIQMPPVTAPVTWSVAGTSGAFSSDMLDGTQGAQHLLGEMPFPADVEFTEEDIPIAVNCVFNDLFNVATNADMTDEQVAANAAKEYWKIDTDGYGLMGSDTFDMDSNANLSLLFQIAPLYKPCGTWQMTNGNCYGSTTNLPENQNAFDWNAYLPGGVTQDFNKYFLQIPVRPICEPGTSCLGGLAFQMCRIRWGKNSSISNVCPGDPCDENATCLFDGQTSYCECNEGFEGDGFTCVDPLVPLEQTCSLSSGWNMVSLYMDPEDPNLEQVLLGLDDVSTTDDIVNIITIVKNYLGQALLPEWGFNGIGDWLIGQGYQIKTTAEVDLTVSGTYLVPEDNPIDLVDGWNMIGYLRVEPADMVAVFQEITDEDNLIIAKDNMGSAYLPEWGFNGIGDMEPCQGYQVKVYEPDVLHFNANNDPY